MKKRGLLVVVSAGSGAGKSTLCRMLLKKRKNLAFSISATTRLPRPGEKEGKDYFFVTEAAFKALHPVFFVFFLVAMDYPRLAVPEVEKNETMVDTGEPAEPIGLKIRA